MKITDGKKTVEIIMTMWDGTNHSPDFSQDFFDAGCLPRDDETGVYTVVDVDYCIEQANDWENGIGDFYDEECAAYNSARGLERCVRVYEINLSSSN